MSLVKTSNRLEFVNYLLKKKTTGDLETFARRNGLSKRAMTDFLRQMKEMGADIRYDRQRRSYYYGRNGEMTSCKFIEYGQALTREEANGVGKPEDLCFSERAVFVPCKDI